jgi:hypothetical protein
MYYILFLDSLQKSEKLVRLGDVWIERTGRDRKDKKKREREREKEAGMKTEDGEAGSKREVMVWLRREW